MTFLLSCNSVFLPLARTGVNNYNNLVVRRSEHKLCVIRGIGPGVKRDPALTGCTHGKDEKA